MTKSDKKKLAFDASTKAQAKRVFVDWVWPHKSKLALSFVLMIIIAGSNALYPLIIKYITDTFVAFTTDPEAHLDSRIIYIVPVAAVVLTTIKATAMYSHSIVSNMLTQRIVASMRSVMFGKIQQSDLVQMTSEPVGKLVSRFTNDTNIIAAGITRANSNLIRDSFQLIALVVTMFVINWKLTLIVLVVYPLAAKPIINIGKRLRRVSNLTQVHLGKMTSVLHESFSGARMVKSFRLEDYEQERADESFEEMYKLQMKATYSRSRIDPMMEVFGGIAVAGVLIFVGHQILVGESTVGGFTAFISAALMTAQPVRALGTLNSVLQETFAATERVFSLLDSKPKITDAKGSTPLVVTAGNIEFQNVTFSYDEEPALDDVSFNVKGGQMIALVGKSGAGKSTILNLLPRFYEAQKGVINVDGQNIRHATLDSLRNAIALVSQDVILFDDTVKANIAFGKMDATDDEIEAAAQAAAAHDFIVNLPEAYETDVGDRGSNLSGGERQRISLARAILKDAPILLLDEATSALDAVSERLVQEALERLSKDRTTLVIAHRLATVQNADLIFVMDKGRIVETGTHNELSSKDGIYAELCRLQFREDAIPDE